MKILVCLSFFATILWLASSTVLQLNDLTDYTWKFFNDGGFLGFITFGANGKITTYSNANEQTWKLDDSHMLQVFDINGQLTVKYVNAFRDFSGKWRLSGRFVPLNNGWTHYLEQII